MAAYLFAHFIGEEKNGEQIYFSVSQDGLHWKDLNNGKPVLFSQTGTCGVRDPFLVRHPQTGTVYLMATDLCIGFGKGWKRLEECPGKWKQKYYCMEDKRSCTLDKRQKL